MELRELRYIFELGITRNLTKAAENLYISQPALSKSLKKVESELGTSLFYRDGKHLCPTEVGAIILEHAGILLKQMEDMNQAVLNAQQMKSGAVRLGIPAVVALIYFPSILVNFKNHYPGIKISITEAGRIELLEKVRGEDLDIAISMRPILCNEVNELLIVSDELVIGMDETHPLADREKIRIEDLAGVPYISFDSGYCIYAQLNERFRQKNIEPMPDILTRECGLMVALAQSTQHICIAPKPILDYYAWPTMVTRPFSPRFPWELCILYRKNAHLSQATKEFIRYIQENFLSNCF